MNGFLRWYRWGLRMKYHMGIYTVGLIFCKGVVNALMGVYEVDSRTMLEMLIASLLLASAETALFPGGLDRPQPRGRTAVWVVLGNLLYVGGSLMFGWFEGIPLWGSSGAGADPGGGIFRHVVWHQRSHAGGHGGPEPPPTAVSAGMRKTRSICSGFSFHNRLTSVVLSAMIGLQE